MAKRVGEACGPALRKLITGYRRYVSPLLGRHCRFYPSCSVYATQAIARHGAARGGWLAVRRLLRCHPFHPGGVDHVPDVMPRGGPSRTPAEGSSLRGAGPSRTPAEGSLMRGAGPSRTPAEGS